MPYYQHYSFDLWLTLIKSDPEFKRRRAQYFHQNHNAHNKSEDEITVIFRQVDLMVNAVNERCGKNIDADEMYLMVINFINDGQTNLEDVNLDELSTSMEDLLFQYPPVPYSSVTIGSLQHLKQNSGATFSLLSNTGFITGKTLRKVLALYQPEDFFNFQLYSDEVNMSKPNKAFFDVMLKNVDTCNAGKTIPKTRIIHIGDNPRNDIKPAQEIGIQSLLINSNTQTILNLLHSK